MLISILKQSVATEYQSWHFQALQILFFCSYESEKPFQASFGGKWGSIIVHRTGKRYFFFWDFSKQINKKRFSDFFQSIKKMLKKIWSWTKAVGRNFLQRRIDGISRSYFRFEQEMKYKRQSYKTKNTIILQKTVISLTVKGKKYLYVFERTGESF